MSFPRIFSPANIWPTLVVILLGVGCGGEEPAPKQPAESVPPAPSATRDEEPAKESAAAPQQTERPADVPDATTAEVTPTPPAPTNDIEDPPVVGEPQEAFNFPRPPLVMPPVLLTDQESKNSLVKVGDRMPNFSLPDLNGKSQQLFDLLGPKLTVLMFWNVQGPYDVEQVGDMGPVIGERFGKHGVEIVGVVEGPDSAAASVIERTGAEFVNLVDADAKVFEQVATAELPRTYLLDENGNVLWFDLEYSRSTRRDLIRAIQFALLNEK